MRGKKKINQIENDDWNNYNDSESEVVTVPKKVTKRSKLKDIDKCKIDSKIAQESIRKKIIKQQKKLPMYNFQIPNQRREVQVCNHQGRKEFQSIQIIHLI